MTFFRILTIGILSLALVAPGRAQGEQRNNRGTDDADDGLHVSDDTSMADFAIETKVYGADHAAAIETRLTIFGDDLILDLPLDGDGERTEFERKSRTFLLARQNPAMTTSVKADELIRFTSRLQATALKSKDPLVRFAAEPKFRTYHDADRNRLSLTSKLWEYHVKLEPVDDDQLLARYREFADWFSHLNSLFRPLPPGLRLKLNEALDDRSSIPQQVTVHIKPGGRRSKITQHTEHRLIQPLGPRERDALQTWALDKSKLPVVDFGQYHAAEMKRVVRAAQPRDNRP